MLKEAVVALLLRKTTEVGSPRKWALGHSILPQYVSDVLRGRRDPGPQILAALGLEKVVTYRRVKP